jgi:hypothetical protein
MQLISARNVDEPPSCWLINDVDIQGLGVVSMTVECSDTAPDTMISTGRSDQREDKL